MGKLIEKDASGKWQVKGYPLEKLREGAVVTKEASQILYGCLCKLKDYEESGINPDKLERLRYEAEDMAGQICDKVCRYRQEIVVQEELDKVCEGCPVSACMGIFLLQG